MKIIVIEDEKLTAEELLDTIIKLQPGTEIIAVLHSVKSGIQFFEHPNHEPDLIFSDIQLGDGTSFDIFSQVKVTAPVIFCTAYDEYALNAFSANGIDYVLKPFTDETIQLALNKYHSLKEKLTSQPGSLNEILKLFTDRKTDGQGAVLVHYKDKILPVAITDIAFFFLKNGVTHLTTFDKKTYYLNKTLDELEKPAGAAFFRVNRQYLVNRKTVVNASSTLSRKMSVLLKVPAEEDVLISKEKITPFLHWLTVL